MAPLPDIRLKMSLRPFTNAAAVDYAGPLIPIQGRSLRAKRYLCLFTCLNTRAIHLEMSFKMDTDSFLNAFSRMTSQRGILEVMFSDNGGNFVKADKELKELVNQLDQEKIKQKTANKGFNGHSILQEHHILVGFMKSWSKQPKKQSKTYWGMQI